MPAGYSGTPLAKKLGIKKGHHIVATIDEPDGFRSLLVDLPDGVELDGDLTVRPEVVVAFYTDAVTLVAGRSGWPGPRRPQRSTPTSPAMS